MHTVVAFLRATSTRMKHQTSFDAVKTNPSVFRAFHIVFRASTIKSRKGSFSFPQIAESNKKLGVYSDNDVHVCTTHHHTRITLAFVKLHRSYSLYICLPYVSNLASCTRTSLRFCELLYLHLFYHDPAPAFFLSRCIFSLSD